MSDTSRLEQYLRELAELTKDPIHKQLIAAYTGDNPTKSMEIELGRILNMVVKHED
ncbi:MAG: hypothetical protein Q8P44_09415 [Dehalococcoidia bacterium]|nr:hypothetical protein [Dehalococcoidia bacterium]